MSRFKRLKNWPGKLQQMTVEQLREEIAYWAMRARFLGHPSARKGALKFAREAEAALERKLASDDSDQ